MLDLRDMSRAQVLRLAVVVATILAVALASAVLAVAALADDGDETDDDATASPALQPTQIIADIPDGYGELFSLQWGGGSLHHLKARLATMGCVANTLWLYDNDRWRPYNQYDLPQAFRANREFRQAYEAFVPAGTLWADCYRICEFIGPTPEWDPSEEWDPWGWGWHDAPWSGEGVNVHSWAYYSWLEWLGTTNTRGCLSYEFLRDPKNLRELGGGLSIYPIQLSSGVTVKDTDPCTNDFDPRVVEHVFPVLPLVPELCIIRLQGGPGGVAGIAVMDYINVQPVVVVDEGGNIYRNSEERDLLRLKVEIHELCHITQNWMWIQGVGPDRFVPVYGGFAGYGTYDLDLEFRVEDFVVGVLGFERLDGQGGLSNDSVYRIDGIYSYTNPTELNAELCAMYLLDMMGMRSGYEYEKYDADHGVMAKVPIRRINVNKYLTPEVRAWLEQWMILPQIDDD